MSDPIIVPNLCRFSWSGFTLDLKMTLHFHRQFQHIRLGPRLRVFACFAKGLRRNLASSGAVSFPPRPENKESHAVHAMGKVERLG
jgi:hypothetical protein